MHTVQNKPTHTTLDFEAMLRESARTHGHLCPGQVLGVRMSLLGLREIGIADPRGRDRKRLIVFVEMDRCATDAVQSVTGCSLGKRTMKFLDYGKMAVTFLNLNTYQAIRICCRNDAREKAAALFPDIAERHQAQLEAYKVMAEEDLFDCEPVTIRLRPEDMPGRPLRRIACSNCGEHVQDMREVERGGRVFCRPCAEGGYYVPGKFKHGVRYAK